MITEEVFAKLKALQDIFAQEYDVNAKIEAMPKQLEDQEQLLLRLKTEFIDMSKVYKEDKDRVLQLHTELDSVIRRREDGEKGMDNITTHREYEALEKQIEDAKIREDELRRDISKQEKHIAEIDDNIKSTESTMHLQQSELDERKKELDAALNDLRGQLEVLKAKEADYLPGIDSDIIFKFRRIIERNRKGIVAIKHNVCDGCHMILPAQFVNDVRDGESIIFCPYCSRILYYQDTNDEEEYFSMDDTGSLADLEDEEYEDTEESLPEDEEEVDEDTEDFN